MRSYDLWYCHGKSLPTSNSQSTNVEKYAVVIKIWGECWVKFLGWQLSVIYGLEENETTQMGWEGVGCET